MSNRTGTTISPVPVRDRGSKALGYLRAALLYRRRGVEYAGRPVIRGRRPIVGGTGSIRVGRSFRVEGAQFPVAFGAAEGGELRLGDRVYLNQGVNIWAALSVTIGSDVRLADLACVYDTDFHELEAGAGVRVAPVVIGDDVWIGRGAIILRGVTIGDHAVVGAGAVVTGDVATASLVVGNPARFVRELNIVDGYVRS